MKSDSTVVNGSTFLVTNEDGTPDRSHDGFYHADTQHLDGYSLSTDQTLESLENVAPRPGERILHAGSPIENGSRTVHVKRHQVVENTLVERVTVSNLTSRDRTIDLTLTAGTRFDDLFEVRGHEATRSRDIRATAIEPQPGSGTTTEHVAGAVFSYDPSDIDYDWATTLVTDVAAAADTTTVSVDTAPGRSDATITATLTLAAHTDATFHVVTTPGEQSSTPAEAFEATRTAVHRREADWDAQTTSPSRDDWDPVLQEAERNLLELTLDTEYGPVLAAGVPWFATVFGRDSLIAAFQSLQVRPDIAKATCRYLAAHQASESDDFRAATPGKILHETRSGETTIREETPHSPYYGTVDATPLFVVLVHEVWRYTGDDAFVRELWPHVEAALNWLTDHGDTDGDGFLEYPADHDGHGLTHQAWKDSGDGIVHADGSHPTGPLAVAEVQGYAYDARNRAADLAERVMGDEDHADVLRRDATELQRQFDDAFWLSDEQFYAVALDGDNEPVTTVTSNPGHCLWSGIVPDHREDAVVDRLLSQDMFTGWGIRTLSRTHAAYNSQSYHRGSVWPHDNSLCVLGIAAAGRQDDARQVARGLVEVARARGNNRLPELFAGFDRDETTTPVEYGEACEPQAWAAATPFALHRAITQHPLPNPAQ
ncbi:glycogen debranching N-terminal domain-containing protein [Halorubrum sp. AD140]|uniref:MGH1-like glycoside hydrolase domain-containing protein n=1 Tax=Halorubrum sp. AD140 TaxID=3050073 RepID=UPI002ACC70B7|nr:glycogen debranching N-terminal domain-containing protein [Halorubrum sp. AD140]MDZ5811818.1 glycogen debranching N-terminal domain-containing protein [Halorubrum sp. AD140]